MNVVKQPAPLFYVVSPRKFTILFLSTFSLYAIYWFYKNWDRYKDQVPQASTPLHTVWPVMRALFSVFFIHSLFRKVKACGSGQPAIDGWHANLHAWWMVFLLLAAEGVGILADSKLGKPYGDLAGFAMLLPQLWAFLEAQRMINVTCHDPDGAGNAVLTKANRRWIGIGVALWVLTLAGMMMHGQH